MKLQIRSKSNYSVVSTSPLLTSSIIHRILQENAVAGVLPYPNIFQPYMVVSDSAEPGFNRWVISKIVRDNFEFLDLDKSWLEAFCLLGNLNDKALYNYVSHNSKMKRLSLTDRYALFLLLLSKPYDRMGFSVTMADDVCGKFFEEAGFDYFEYMKTVVTFLNCPNQSNFVSTVRQFPDSKYPLLKSILRSLTDRDVPGLLLPEISDQISNSNFKTSLLSLATFLSRNDWYEPCILYMSSMVRK